MVPNLLESNKMVFKGTFTYYKRLTDSLTVAEACAILMVLGNYQVDYIYYRCNTTPGMDSKYYIDKEGSYWESIPFDKIPVNTRCRLKNIVIPIRFYGGPPEYRYYFAGYLSSFVCDRILQCCLTKGKTPTSKTILQTLARVRRKDNG